MAMPIIKITPAAREYIAQKNGSIQLVETRVSTRG